MIKTILKLCGYKYIRIYLKSGNNFMVVCKSFHYRTLTETTGFASYRFESIISQFSSFPVHIVIGEIEAVTME